MELLAYFKSEWTVLSQAPVIFGTAMVLICGIVYAVVRHQFGDRLSSLEGRLQLKDDQLDDYKNKLNNASPDEARDRIDQLEKRIGELARFAPRSLSQEQRNTIRHIVAKHASNVTVMYDGSAADGGLFANALIEAFRSAGWQVGTGVAVGLSNAPNSGLAVRVTDPENLSKPEQTIISALEASKLAFEVQRGSGRDPSPFLVITSKLA